MIAKKQTNELFTQYIFKYVFKIEFFILIIDMM
jgi:hypothetical protein